VKRLIVGWEKHRSRRNKDVGEIKEENRRERRKESQKGGKRDGAATLSDLHPSTCLTWEALPYKNSSQHSYPGQ